MKYMVMVTIFIFSDKEKLIKDLGKPNEWLIH